MKKFIAFTLLYWVASMTMLLFVERPVAVVGGFTAVYVIIGLYELAKLFPLCHDHGSDEQDDLEYLRSEPLSDYQKLQVSLMAQDNVSEPLRKVAVSLGKCEDPKCKFCGGKGDVFGSNGAWVGSCFHCDKAHRPTSFASSARPLPTPWSENGIEDDKLEYKDGKVSVTVTSASFPTIPQPQGRKF